MATKYDRADSLATLIRLGAEINSSTSGPLVTQTAARWGSLGVLKALHAMGVVDASSLNRAIFTAVSFGQVECIRLLVQLGGDVNVRIADTGATPLHTAASQGARDQVIKVREKDQFEARRIEFIQ